MAKTPEPPDAVECSAIDRAERARARDTAHRHDRRRTTDAHQDAAEHHRDAAQRHEDAAKVQREFERTGRKLEAQKARKPI